jgi:anti-anti-sigma factor
MGEPLSVQTDGDGCRVVVATEFDLAVEQPFVELVAEQLAAGHPKVHVDLGAVDFIDSSGVRALLRVHLDHPGQIDLVRVPEPVIRVLAVAGLEDTFVIGNGDP